MNITVDRETNIVGLGLTQTEANESMLFYRERCGYFTASRLERRKELHTWLPRPNMIHVKGIGPILFENNTFINLVTGRKVKVRYSPMAHYLSLFVAFDGMLSFDDFTITISPEINRFMSGISDKFSALKDFPYVKPVEDLHTKHYHGSYLDKVSVIETINDTIVLDVRGSLHEVDRVLGIDVDCLLSYLFASQGFLFDGVELREV